MQQPVAATSTPKVQVVASTDKLRVGGVKKPTPVPMSVVSTLEKGHWASRVPVSTKAAATSVIVRSM